MPRMYPASVRRQIVFRLRSGESVAAIAVDTGICQATLFPWKRQALIDSGVIEGIASVEADELAAAHRRIAALEAELADPDVVRWPAYGTAMLAHQIRGVYAMPVGVPGQYVGALDRFRYRSACRKSSGIEQVGEHAKRV